MNFNDFLYEGVADTHLQNKFHFKPDFSDFEDEYKKIKSKEEDKIVYSEDKFVIIKNPKTLENVDNSIRGVIDKDGNLYISQFRYITHSPIISILSDLNLIQNTILWHKEIPTNFITIQRYDNTNIFCIGESNQFYYRDKDVYIEDSYIKKYKDVDYKAEFQKFLDKAKIKNPQYEFINEYIMYYPDELEEKNIYEEISLDDINIKVDNSSDEFLNTIKNDFSLLIYKRTPKHIRPRKISGHLQQEELHIRKKNNRSTLNILMNNGDIIIGTYNTLSYNISITINNEILYDIKLKTCDDNKLLEKMVSEYKKYLKNKGYQIKNDNNNE